MKFFFCSGQTNINTLTKMICRLFNKYIKNENPTLDMIWFTLNCVILKIRLIWVDLSSYLFQPRHPVVLITFLQLRWYLPSFHSNNIQYLTNSSTTYFPCWRQYLLGSVESVLWFLTLVGDRMIVIKQVKHYRFAVKGLIGYRLEYWICIHSTTMKTCNTKLIDICG